MVVIQERIQFCGHTFPIPRKLKEGFRKSYGGIEDSGTFFAQRGCDIYTFSETIATLIGGILQITVDQYIQNGGQPAKRLKSIPIATVKEPGESATVNTQFPGVKVLFEAK